MNLNYIEALYYVAKLGSISQAAQYLKLTQPTVTQKIRMLEEEVGVPLIIRGSRGVKLTEEGQLFFDHAKRVVEEVESLRKNFVDDKNTALKILTTQGLGVFILPEVMSQLIAGTDQEVEIKSMSQISNDDLNHSDLYMGPFLEGLEATHKMQPFYDFQFSFYASKAYLASKGHPRTVQDLKQHDFIGFTDDKRSAFHETDLFYLLTDPDFKQPKIRVNSTYSEIQFAKQDLGIVVLSEKAEGYFKTDLVPLSIKDFEPLVVPTYFFVRKEVSKEKAQFCQKILTALQDYLDTLSG